jgi:ribosomal protein S18 acetylase RimI-like enzyme
VAQAGVHIEPARPQDAEGLVALRRAVLAEGCWFATRADEYVEGATQARAAVAALRRQANGTLLVARLDGQLVGMLAVHGEGLARMRHLGRLEMMVARDLRGQGIGRALLAEALRWARANPVLRKLSLAVFEDNGAAVALYRSRGFAQEGRREGEYLLEDGSRRADLLMALELR